LARNHTLASTSYGPYAGYHITGKDILIVSLPNASVVFPTLFDYGHVSNFIPFLLTTKPSQLIACELVLQLVWVAGMLLFSIKQPILAP
jgi:hypothetical protein